MQSRRPSGLALAVPHLPHRRSSLLSLDSAASPHTPRSCASALPPPDLYLQPTISKRTSTTSWNSSNADEMDFDWKPDQVLLLSRTLDALPAHLVTPFHGPIPPSNLLDKIARGVSQAKGPLDWPHSIRATRVKLLELARARAKDDTANRKKKEQPQLLPPKVVVDGYFDDQNPDHPDDGSHQRRPLYKQSSMDFITPDSAEIKDNSTIAQLSNRLQRTDRPAATYHPYKSPVPSRIAVRSRTANNTTLTPDRDRKHGRSTSSSPPPASDVPDLIVPNPNSLSNSSSNSSFSSSVPPSAAAMLRPPLLRRSASTLSSSSMYSSSSSGSGRALQDKRLQRVREAADAPPLMGGTPPVPPPKDYPSSTPTKGTKRAASYGALAQGVRQEGAFLRAMKDVIAQEGSGEGNAGENNKPRKNKDKENTVQKHTRQPSYPSSDEEEKARAKRAKKMRGAVSSGHAHAKDKLMMSPGVHVPPSPSVVSLSSSASGESSSVSAPGTPMVLVSAIPTAPSTPQPQDAVRAPTPPAKDRVLASPKALRTPAKGTKTMTRVLLKPAPTVLIGSPERDVVGKEEAKETTTKARATKKYLYGEISEMGGVNNAAAPASPAAANAHNKRPSLSAPRMNAQRNPSMFGMELPRLSAALSSSSAAPAVAASNSSVPAPSRHKHARTLSRESAGTATSASTGSSSSMVGSTKGSLLPPLCGDAALSVPPSPLTLRFAQDVRRRVLSSPAPVSVSISQAMSPAPAPASATVIAITASPPAAAASLTASPTRAKTLRRVRGRLAPSLAPTFGKRISFGSLLESTDDMGMDVDARDDRSFDLSGGRMGLGLGGGLGLSFGGDEREREGTKKGDNGGSGHTSNGSVFGAVLGEAFSVQPRAVALSDPRERRERKRSRDEDRDRDGERTAARGLGSAFRMA